MGAFTSDVDRHFGFLRSAGFEVLVNEASPSFDNGLAIFRSAHQSIQVVRDRGYWLFEAGPLGDLRYADHFLTELLAASSGAVATEVNHRDPAAVAEQLRQMLPWLEAVFAPDRSTETIAALRRLVELRLERLVAEDAESAKRAT
jgi:hypothetical protein